MKNKNLDNDFGVPTSLYQRHAAHCMEVFLKNFAAASNAGKNFSLKMQAQNAAPFSLRIRENPPSVQIRKFPVGGINKGAERIRSLIERNESSIQKLRSGLLLPEDFTASFATAQESDLTRECIMVTLADETLAAIEKSGLISPAAAIKSLQSLQKIHPRHFIVFQRYLLGIEHRDGVKVPFSVVTEKDRATFEYLETLAHELSRS